MHHRPQAPCLGLYLDPPPSSARAFARKWRPPVTEQAPTRRVRRIRIGVVLMLASWIPAPLVVDVIVSLMSSVPSSSTQHTITAIAWTCEVLIGLVGVWLAGAESVSVMKSVGWRQTPKVVWGILVHGG